MKKLIILIISTFIITSLITTTILLKNYYKKTPTKTFQVGIKYLSNNEWKVDLTEFGKAPKELIETKKYNYYDHNLYTYDIMPLDIIEYYYQANQLKVFIKPVLFKYDYFLENKKYSPDLTYFYEEKTNYNLNENQLEYFKNLYIL